MFSMSFCFFNSAGPLTPTLSLLRTAFLWIAGLVMNDQWKNNNKTNNQQYLMRQPQIIPYSWHCESSGAADKHEVHKLAKSDFPKPSDNVS